MSDNEVYQARQPTSYRYLQLQKPSGQPDLRLDFESQEKHGTTCPALRDGPTETKASKAQRETYAHCGIYLGHCLFIRRELVDLDAVADQLAHDFTLELVQLVFGDGVSLGNDGDDVHLQDKDSTP